MAAQTRLRIFRRPRPYYDSGDMVTAKLDQIKLIFGGNRVRADQVVVMQMYDDPSGYHNRFIGGNYVGTRGLSGLTDGAEVGQRWFWLNDDDVSLQRTTNDLYSDRTRVRIFPSPGDVTTQMPVTLLD